MQTLEEYRREVDALDNELVAVLARRVRLIEEIARFKRREGIPMMQHGRVAAVLARCGNLAGQHGIPPGLVTRIYEIIIEESCRIEDAIIDAPGEAGAAR